MQDINRYFEFMEKEDVIKKIVSLEFGKFLAYYADAPEIEAVADKKEKKPQTDREKLQNKAQKGYRRLFINLGKRDGFYPGELMQMLNRFVGGRQEVGHIDLLDTISYFEVPEKDARKVMLQLSGIRFKGRQVRCNDADEGGKPRREEGKARREEGKPRREDGQRREESQRRGKQREQARDEWQPKRQRKQDWRDLMKQASRDLRGPEPDFSEEGWAIRKPRKKK